MSRPPCKRCQGAQAVRPGGLCNRCFSTEGKDMKQQQKPELIPIDRIRIDGGTQARVATNPETIANYAEHLADGGILPPAVVFFDGEHYWLADGFQRRAAHLQAQLTELACLVHSGTRRDAVLHAVGSNAEHGLPRTREDKARAVKILLEDAEWAAWSDREIAERCKVSPGFVGKQRTALAESTGQTPSTERTFTRDGQQYSMDTSAIGRRTDFAESETTEPAASSVRADRCEQPRPASEDIEVPMPTREELAQQLDAALGKCARLSDELQATSKEWRLKHCDEVKRGLQIAKTALWKFRNPS